MALTRRAGELVAPGAAAILAGLGDKRRLRARVLESQPQNFGGGLAVIGEKKRLVGIAHQLRFDAEMPVPVDHVAQIRDDGVRIGRMRPVDAPAADGLAAAAGCGARSALR